jgi:uncharacterized MAPEG superfamily protein
MPPISALALFGFLTLALVAFEIMYTYATLGFGFGFSSNRPQVELSKFAVRVKRTLQNHVESAAYVVPALTAAHLAGLQGGAVGLAALLIVAGRAAYALLYYSGVPFVRVPAFTIANLLCMYLMYLALTAEKLS